MTMAKFPLLDFGAIMKFFVTFVALILSFQAVAEDRTRAILVMDGSGSMWGQIDGTAKITIAQEVVGALLDDLPNVQELGLTVYGHRRKGDCSDIETMVEPAAGTREAISAAVNAISPRGKTPMTDAVIAAAKALRYTEEKATVILVSDGIETCAPDPCAAARALEQSGVDFTAHVIGFDVRDDAKALAQMQCIADETGGIFRTASNASELSEALAVVTEPDPEFTVEIIATEGDNGPRITDGILWDIGGTSDGPWLVQNDAAGVQLIDQLPEGILYVRVFRPLDGAVAEHTFTIDGTTPDVLTLVLPELPPEPIKLIARAYLVDSGDQVTDGLIWSLTNKNGDGLRENVQTKDVVELLSPGTYLVEVVRIEDEAFAEKTVVITEQNDQVVVRLELPEITLPAKLSFEARLEGTDKVISRDLVWSVVDGDAKPVYDSIGLGDFVEAMPGRYTVSATRTEDGVVVAQEVALTKTGKKVVLKFPPYAPLATLRAPTEAPVGSTFLVDWTGPNEKNDFVSIAKIGDADSSNFNYEYTRQGPTLELTMPAAPGAYEVRYYMAKEGRVVARVPITGTPVNAALSAPDEAPSGSTVAVEWTGPGYKNDYIDVSALSAGNTDYVHYSYTRKGSPAQIEMPIEPGTYQLRYVMALDKVILATRQITVTEETFAVSGPAEAFAGETIKVDWIGPNLSNDFIAVAKIGSKSSEYASYQYTRKGTPVSVALPMEPGEYEIRYVVSQGKENMANYSLTILPVTGSITAANSAVAGDTIEVSWDGPGYNKDFVAVAEAGSKIESHLGYKYTRSGKLLAVQVPSQPGDYELRYVAHSVGRALLASQTLTVTEVSASVSGPSKAVAGSQIDVTWEGPGYRRDYVAIFAEGEEEKYTTYQYTRKGTTLSLDVPVEPGNYEIRYVMKQDRRTLYSMQLVVE